MLTQRISSGIRSSGPYGPDAAVSDSRVAGTAARQSAAATGIAFYNKHGQGGGFVDTGSYIPESLCFPADHSLWTVGWQRNGEDYMMVHHFTPDRKDAGKFLARSLVPEGLEPGLGQWQ